MAEPTGRDRWLLAGQELLRSGGAPAVKLERLSAATGLTVGSFYHHFSGMPGYLEALASYYGAGQVEEKLAAVAGLAPLERLRALSRVARFNRMQALDAAMRDWAGTDVGAERAVREADQRLLAFMVDAFTELGHDRPAARLRAITLLSVGVARIHSPWTAGPRHAERLLAMLSAPD